MKGEAIERVIDAALSRRDDKVQTSESSPAVLSPDIAGLAAPAPSTPPEGAGSSSAVSS